MTPNTCFGSDVCYRVFVSSCSQTLPASASWRSLITSDRWDAQLKYQTNILGDSSRREAIVIDPRAPTQLILSVIREMGCSLKQILLTARYTECNRIAYELQKKVNGDAQILLHPEHEHSWNLFASRGEVITNLHDGQPLALFDGRAVFAPGPPSGTCCFYFPTLGLLCTGRRLVNAGVRRPEDGTDVAELEEWLLQFPPSTVIAPGFGQRTTVEFQMEITKKQLKRLQGEDDGEEEGEDPTYGGDEDEDEDLDDAQVQVIEGRTMPLLSAASSSASDLRSLSPVAGVTLASGSAGGGCSEAQARFA